MNKLTNLTNPERFIRFILGVLPFVVLVTMFSCEEDPNSLGADLLPDSDKIGYFYDTTIIFNGYMTNEEEFSTKFKSITSLGYMNDPFFGTIQANFATSIVPTSLNINFEIAEEGVVTQKVVVDSVRLNFIIDSVYGERDENTGFNVYKIIKQLKQDDTLTSTTPIEDYVKVNDPINIDYSYTTTKIVDDNDSTKVTLLPTLSFKINNSYGEFLAFPADSIGYYRKEETIIEKIFGLAVIPEQTSLMGEIASINLYHEKSELILYFHRVDAFDGSRQDTLQSLSYRFYSGNERNNNYTQILYDHEQGEIQNYLDNDSTTADDLIALQGLGGMSSKIIFNNYKELIGNSKYSIINASLEVPVYKDADFSTLYPPEKLYFISLDTDSTLYQIDDYTTGKFFNGAYNSDLGIYEFDISMHLQELLNEVHTDSILYFRQISSSIYPHRAILDPNKIKLKVTYTKH